MVGLVAAEDVGFLQWMVTSIMKTLEHYFHDTKDRLFPERFDIAFALYLN